MEIKEFTGLYDDAILIRQKVFVEEQGFRDEFDEIDKIATHLVAYDNSKPIAVCRFFWSDERGAYLIGRLAVIKEYRGKQLGADILKKAEELVKAKGGKAIELHSQEQATGFYEKQGYTVCSEMEYEEHCPHYWMRKEL
ncbi:MAG: GNAT family N-acetyltransferase [Eubacterium sp.]|nr:GNAT family N-acetyltransferase [Eubacterium sp.]